MGHTYADTYAASLSDPEQFWLDAAGAIDWSHAPTRALDGASRPFYRWFPDGVMNTCHNALDRHVEAGRGEQPALIYDSPVADERMRYSYAELTSEVARFASALAGLGVGKGDRVVIYMPMVPQVAIAMLACARLGAVHSVVFGGFGAKELAARIADAEPTVLVCASCGIEPSRVVEYKPIVDDAMAAVATPPRHVVVFQRKQARATMTERDIDWGELMAGSEPADCVDVAATDPLYVLYTSGTTGNPRGWSGTTVATRWR
ncbi:propionyl-CoA synthetase [Rhodococcus percolatus]|nr:propionyl-CoA synthetase [Rhodococcus opacus]MBP2207527.1 propionyl-CoA synthetase [Rhodococcus opacus]CAG7580125.1 Acetyl-coenzyme A synthetase [Rhodococcus opacus]